MTAAPPPGPRWVPLRWVRLPRRTVRHSPAAMTVHLLSGSTITQLARVLAGR